MTRREIEEIRKVCKAKQEKLKLKKDLKNEAKKHYSMRPRSNSYTISSPSFPVERLPEISEKFQEHKSTAIEEFIITYENKSLTTKQKDLEDFEEISDIQFKFQIQKLIKQQKEEYLEIINILKKRFLSEQKQMLQKLKCSMLKTSTPMTSSFTEFEDEEEDAEFTKFQTCLQSAINTYIDTTLVDDNQITKENAATVINAYARGYLVRRLLKTSYVRECKRNILDILQLILTLDQRTSNNDEIQELFFKTKLFQQLQGDLCRFSDIFCMPVREKMKLISNDRDRLAKAPHREI